MEELSINKTKTALVIIDLQKGITSFPGQLMPYSSKEVVSNASKLAEAFRKNNMPVCLVHVQFSKETGLFPDSDTQMHSAARELPADWADFVPELNQKPSDIVISKRQWGAFYGTDLELQLRRRKIDTIVLCGIATHIGVESTARFAYEYGFTQIFAEDAMTTMSQTNGSEHHNSVNAVFKRMGKVRSTEKILESLK